MSGTDCMICLDPDGELRVDGKENPEVGDAYVCDKCWKLLQDPRTAVPLMRGHLMLTGRQFYEKKDLRELVDSFMEKVRKLEPRN